VTHDPEHARDNWAIVVALFGLGNFLNGAWMLASPAHWYYNLPANVPGSGPLNEHFVRDVGCIFFLLGVLLLVSIRRRELRLSAMVAASAFAAAHALVHVFDSMRGLFAPGQWRFDLGPVYITTLLLVAMTWRLAREERQ
jgi:hypothetical protein